MLFDTFFICNRFISNYPSEVKVLSNFQSKIILQEIIAIVALL